MQKTQRAKKIKVAILNDTIIQSIQEKKGEEVICLDLKKIKETVVDYKTTKTFE